VKEINRRGLRLEWVAGLGLALALLPAQAQQMASATSLNVETSDVSGRTQASASVAVTGADGLAASGVVSLEEGSRQLAQVALDGQGKAAVVVALSAGAHTLRAVYAGDATHLASASAASDVTGAASASPNFTLTLSAVAPSTLPLKVTAGQTGTVAVTIVPQDNAALNAPMFVSLSCSGLPALSSCTFTPESIEILSTTPASCAAGSPASSCPPVSSMLIQTQGQGGASGASALPGALPRRGSTAVWAIVLPGMLGLGGLAWGTKFGRARGKHWLQRLALVGLLGLFTILGTTACSPLYSYYHHPPLDSPTPPTPSGTFNITVTGQSSNGVTSISNNTTMVLTVQ